jgi:REP element-mobilizing transposase RayT
MLPGYPVGAHAPAGICAPRIPLRRLTGRTLIARGIEGRKIFRDESDYESFLIRLEKVLKKTGNKCLAYSLLGNHFHLLILRGDRPLAELMRRLMTGYAVYFNLRHRRAGHLFQNRYRAILCEFDAYLLELVAYIYLNPLRAGQVEDLGSLRKYRWCGHGVILGKWEAPFLSPEDILGYLGNHRRQHGENTGILWVSGLGSTRGGSYPAGE